jgi:predicted ATPase
LETLKAYANEHLEPEQRHQLLSRHAAFFAALATKYADADPEERPATPIICADWANFRAALEWALYYGNNYDVGTRLLYALRRLPELHDNPELKVWLPYELATDSVR